MKYTLVGMAIAVTMYGAGVLIERFSKSRPSKPGGFREWVKNPDGKKAAGEYFAARDALTVPDDLFAAEIQRMVDRLFVEKDEDFNIRRLSLVGAKAVPFLVKALEHPGATGRFGEGGHALAAKTPFARICELLEPLSPPAAAHSLAAYVDHGTPEFRRQAALLLGSIGTAECIRPVLTALADEDDYVRSYAMMGIDRGIDRKRCTKGFLDAMFPAVAKLLNRRDESVGGDAPRLLLAMDPKRALSVLFSPEYFTIENREVHHLLRALNLAGHNIPREILLSFLAAVKPISDHYPHDDEYAEALKAYACNPDGSAEQLLRAELDSPHGRIQQAAAEALGVLVGVTDASKTVSDAVDKRGFAGLSLPHRHYLAVATYNGEVRNGGHAQYFVNAAGQYWKAALAGLKTIGAGERAEILQQAAAVFGAAGPSLDGSIRHRQLAAFTPRQDQALDDLDGKYDGCQENFDALLARYATAHQEHFVAL